LLLFASALTNDPSHRPAADLLAASLVTVKPSTKPKGTSLVVWP